MSFAQLEGPIYRDIFAYLIIFRYNTLGKSYLNIINIIRYTNLNLIQILNIVLFNVPNINSFNI